MAKVKSINRKQVLEKLRKGEGDKKKVTLYLSESLYEDFKAACEDIPASKVIEELIREFLS